VEQVGGLVSIYGTGENVLLMSTLHRDGKICGQEQQETEIIIDYNVTKGGVDNLDTLMTGYSCKRRTHGGRL
jgi:hypothetical protein